MNCPICDSGCGDHFIIVHDDRYGFPGRFDLLRCRECRHLYLQHDFSSDCLGDLYFSYYPRSEMELGSYKHHVYKAGFSSWLDGANGSAFRWVPSRVRVLDIGCGFGEALRYHAARGCDAYGVEADENIRRVADKLGYKIHMGLFNASLYEPNFFDYVTMNQVFEHMTDPLATLKGVARILKPGGTAAISFPNANGWGAKVFGRKWINWHAPYHLHFYSNESLERLTSQAGLEIVESRTITPSAWLHIQWMHMIAYPKPGEPSKFWAGSACGKPVEFTMVQRLLMRLAGLVHQLKINHLATRLFDALGVGDNRLVLLKKR